MIYKSIIRMSLILALAAVPMTGLAQEADQPTGADLGQPGPWIMTFFGTEYFVPNLVASQGNVETKVEVGYYDASVGGSDSPDMAAEYLDTENGPTVSAAVASHGKGGSFQFLAAYQSKETNAAALDFDVKRTWRSKTGYQKFLHRLGHDPMTNLEATSCPHHRSRCPRAVAQGPHSGLHHLALRQLPHLQPEARARREHLGRDRVGQGRLEKRLRQGFIYRPQPDTRHFVCADHLRRRPPPRAAGSGL
jgi:hypothetical protein